jgi:hypothetical protein
MALQGPNDFNGQMSMKSSAQAGFFEAVDAILGVKTFNFHRYNFVQF